MTTTNKPMTGAQLDELMAVAMRMQSDSEKMGERSVSMFAYAVQVAVLEIRETRCKYEELQSQNADMAVQLANAESKCRELAAENVALKEWAQDRAIIDDAFEQESYTYLKIDWRQRSLRNIETPATDAFLAEVRAQGVEIMAAEADQLMNEFGDDSYKVMVTADLQRFANAFAAQLRKGAAI
ncbi:hypothetical protein DPK38_10835 [Salmonella enterica subsp. enterica serovar Coeln]|nr:hypothetical protein [Salmonella enterica subsp. enterica serovar Coeln]EBQ8836527.1 hypothetical protein [Salmonella enterica subsp. enterica serovar Coeln]EBW4161357.1 hypothetical protein [Salmonella enterica subsp. enterica serovar Coeln]EBX0094141.1 hypothetical protein [Salmonella enterica subsp. enterica serovar Coeln]EBX0136625.1 hypothetical protein [Salmonella enterica subsp. enterica serovar Coeln]